MVKVNKVVPRCKDTDYCKFEGHEQWWGCLPNSEKILLQAETGLANYEKGIPLKTLPQIFMEAVEHNADKIAIAIEELPPLKDGETPPGPIPRDQWKSWTWTAYHNDVRKTAKALIASGMQKHQGVTVFGFNSPEWAMSMFGAIFAGGICSGIYPTDNEETLKYKADLSDSVVCVVENMANFNKVKSVADQLPTLAAIVCWTEDPGADFQTADGRTIKTYTFKAFLEYGETQDDKELDERIANIKPGQCCALIFTSGTTGPPKATMMCHDNIIFAFSAAYKSMEGMGKENIQERTLSYLPLSHVAGMMLDIIGPVGISANIAGFKGWMTIYFARPYDLKVGTFGARIGSVKPTLFFGVPRVWEKFAEKLEGLAASQTGLKKKIFGHAMKQGYKRVSSRQLGGAGKEPWMFLANKVHNKIKGALGLDEAKVMISAAAPLKTETLEFFAKLNMNVLECYGMSESCALATWSKSTGFVWGSVGSEFVGVEVKVLKQEDGSHCPYAKDMFNPSEEEQGEICFRGRSIMIGYMANPRFGPEHLAEIEQKNREAIDAKGWMHSGDKGTEDVRGMFRITGRYKELIIGAGGENIAPVPIEDAVKQACPIISNVMMVGNKRKFNVMVITLKSVGATGITPGTDEILPPYDQYAKTITEARKNDVVIKMIEDAIKKTNKNKQAVVSNAAKVQKFTILPTDFSIMTGELTATQKLIRNAVDDKYKAIIDKMYEVETVYVDYDLAA